MLDDAERRTLADIEHRITDEDPVLSLLARRLSAVPQRQERRERPDAAVPVPTHRHRRREAARWAVLVAGAAVVIGTITLVLSLVALSGSVAVTHACFLPGPVAFGL